MASHPEATNFQQCMERIIEVMSIKLDDSDTAAVQDAWTAMVAGLDPQLRDRLVAQLLGSDYLIDESVTNKSYKAKMVDHVSTQYQDIKVYNHDFFGKILAIDDDIQITERDEHIYHEMIAHVPLAYLPEAISVCIFGGGDGGAAREVLKHPNIERVFLVDIDREVIAATKKHFPKLASVFDHPKLKLVIEDASTWVTMNNQQMAQQFDVIIMDTTDFNQADRVLSEQFISNAKPLLKQRGMFVINGDCLHFCNDSVVDILDVMRKVFKHAYAYTAQIPTFSSGTYAFIIASDTVNTRHDFIDIQRLRDKKLKTKYYTPDVHKAAFVLPPKLRRQFGSRSPDKLHLGYHITVDVGGIPVDRIGNNATIVNLMHESAVMAGLKVVRECVHEFQPQGMTAMLLLSTSHMSIHTFPEKGKVTFDLYSCNMRTRFQAVIDAMLNYFGGAKHNINIIERKI